MINLMPGQKWMPREVLREYHPFDKGQIISVSTWLASKLMVNVIVVGRTRSFKYHRRQSPVDQVEILGLPERWFTAAHFY